MKLESEWFRPASCYLVLEKKMKQKDVALIFGVRPSTVSDAIKRYKETGEHKNQAGQGRKRTAKDDANVDKVKKLLDLNNHTKRRKGESGNSVRKIAKKLEIPKSSVHEILKDDLKLTAWKKTKGQKLTDTQKENRLKRAKAMKTRFANGKHRQILFTDEKFFPIQESFNHQNDRIWSSEKPSNKERVVERQMKPKGVMVWVGVGYNAKAPLIFVSSGLKINTDLYRREILKPIKRWALGHYGVDNKGKFLRIFFDETICFQVIGMNGLFNKIQLHHTQASKLIQKNSRFLLKSGLMSSFRISSLKMSGQQLRLI